MKLKEWSGLAMEGRKKRSMKTRSRRILPASIAMVAAAVAIVASTTVPARAITEAGFVSGLGAWQAFGDALPEDTATTRRFQPQAAGSDLQRVQSSLPTSTTDAALLQESSTGLLMLLGLLGLAAAGRRPSHDVPPMRRHG